MTTAAKVKKALKELANLEKAAFFPRFFKAGKGEYAEGDKFIGVTVPNQRKIAKRFKELSKKEVVKLIHDPLHECRLTGLLILVLQFQKGDESEKRQAVETYLNNLEGVNNWDLVDSTAEKILGPYLEDKDRKLLYKFAKSNNLWKQRIAIVATLQYIKSHDFADTISIADLLLNHEHDLIHKATGWMLREMGKRDEKVLIGFLKSRYKKMPRKMLRYAIEKFD